MKENVLKKELAIMLAGMLGVFVLAGCASQAPEDAIPQNENTTPSSYTEEDAEKARALLAGADQQRADAAERLRAQEEADALAKAEAAAQAEAEAEAEAAAQAAAEAEAAAQAEAEAAAEMTAGQDYYEEPVYYEEPIYYDGGGQSGDTCVEGGVVLR